MTNREFYTAVIASVDNDELKAFATDAIAKLDARNAKRASKPSKKSLENEPIKASIREFLTDGSHLASEIAKGLDLSVSKVSALCRQMVGDCTLTVEDVKVKGKGTQKSYSLAQSKGLALANPFLLVQNRTYVRGRPGSWIVNKLTTNFGPGAL